MDYTPAEDSTDHCPLSQTTIRNGRMLADYFDIFVSSPQNDLLSEREENEAYVLAQPGQQYAVYFPDDGNVVLDVTTAQGPLELRWLDIDNSTWQDPLQVDNQESLTLQTPEDEDLVVVIRRNTQ